MSTSRATRSARTNAPATLELGENPIALLLLLVAVNRERRPPVLAKVLGELVGDALRRDEDEDLGRLGRDLLEVANELLALFEVGADLRTRGLAKSGKRREGSGPQSSA